MISLCLSFPAINEDNTSFLLPFALTIYNCKPFGTETVSHSVCAQCLTQWDPDLSCEPQGAAGTQIRTMRICFFQAEIVVKFEIFRPMCLGELLDLSLHYALAVK